MVDEATAEYCEAVSEERGNGRPESQLSEGLDTTAAPVASAASDLDVIESDLAAIETALNRLEAGTYWTDEVTGETLPDSLLEQNPLARRLPR